MENDIENTESYPWICLFTELARNANLISEDEYRGFKQDVSKKFFANSKKNFDKALTKFLI